MRLVLVLFLFFFTSCQDTQETTSQEASLNPTTEIITKKDIQSLSYIEYVADVKVERAISGWEKYNELLKVIVDIKDANLSFLRDNTEIVEALIKDLKSTIPEKVNSPHVEARIIAFETKLFKLESTVNLSNAKKETLLNGVKEVLVAFSNLNLQMNKKLEKESQNIQKPN